jgi:hypothetical protein
LFGGGARYAQSLDIASEQTYEPRNPTRTFRTPGTHGLEKHSLTTVILLDTTGATIAIGAAIVAISGIALWFALRRGARGARRPEGDAGRDSARDFNLQNESPSAEPASTEVHFATFDERPLADVERAFDELLLRGIFAVEPATPESLVTAQVPAHAGPVFRALARRFRSVRLPEVDVTITLHRGEIAEDAIGGWRFRAEPEEIDIRLAPPSGPVANESGDVVFDATWSPRASAEVARHSSILHFLVRAAVGDRF